MRSPPRLTVLALTGILIIIILYATLLLANAIYWAAGYLLGYPATINLPFAARIPGLVILATGLVVLLDVLRYRRIKDILFSTADTFTKMITRKPLRDMRVRTEPFIPKGPYVYVRNPMYFAVLTVPFGLGLFFSSTPFLLWGLVLTCWYWFYEIPFEEKELEALFGAGYRDYQRQVPKLFPYGKRYRPHNSSTE